MIFFKRRNYHLKILQIVTSEAVRRRKLTFLAIYAVAHSIEYTCACIDIKPSTVQRWINNDKLFNDNFNAVSEKQGE